ncbi:hypothetical protein FOZ76_07090 [Verticiella sediminum]|uniref:Uncharacterized protein n=1 Tax=Verticiella sediminum TaxID=1247510 RepID=A0A556AVW2_9BURK|nr:hypothetical protein [Verticiella sediminum]TSH97081.1 hypothetical protein FOZ76_07090 [Verticiella sediminum]
MRIGADRRAQCLVAGVTHAARRKANVGAGFTGFRLDSRRAAVLEYAVSGPRIDAMKAAQKSGLPKAGFLFQTGEGL